MIRINIDGNDCAVESGLTILQVLKQRGIAIPTLCYHPSLTSSGSCKLCAVEVSGTSGGRSLTMLACVGKVKSGMTIRTQGDIVHQARARAFNRLFQMAPQSETIGQLARQYGFDPGETPDGCIRCRLCIRVCREIVGPGALKMEKRGNQRFVVPVKGRCVGSGTCVNICPTGVIKAEDKGAVRRISIRGEVIGEHTLEKCQGCGTYYATANFIHHIQDRTVTHTETKETHKYCPNCAKLFSNRLNSIREHAQR
jgi:bidirectional [NiFe] hydrogenase diaphorase subunit